MVRLLLVKYVLQTGQKMGRNLNFKTTYIDNEVYLTILGCLNSFRSDISLMAVLGTPSSSDSRRIFLSAANFPVLLFLAL